jgi:hypothetical protein
MVAAIGQAAGAARTVELHTGPPPDDWAAWLLTPRPPGSGPVIYRNVDPPRERREWAVVLYSGECEEHVGLRCAMQAVGPCTLAETDLVVGALPPGMDPHRVALLAPADFMPDPSAVLDRG